MDTQIYDITGSNNKAKNHVTGTKNELYSYTTKVAEYDSETREMKVLGYHSATTGRHINAFFLLFGFPTMTKSELFKKYNLTK